MPDLRLPGGTRKRAVTTLLHRALRHYEIAATLGPCIRVMHSCRPVLDTGARVNIARTSMLPKNWMAYAEKLTTLPRIRDANNNRLVTKYAIHLYVDTGGVRLFDRFLVSDNLSVPCILGTEFIEQNIEGIFPRLRKIVWQEHVRCTEELHRPTPILACLNVSAWDRHWQDRPARVRACKQVRVNGHKEEWIMAMCDTPGHGDDHTEHSVVPTQVHCSRPRHRHRQTGRTILGQVMPFRLGPSHCSQELNLGDRRTLLRADVGRRLGRQPSKGWYRYFIGRRES